MGFRLISEEELLELLDSEQGDLHLLVGAGASMLAPSNLPSGDALRDSVVRTALTHLPDRRSAEELIELDRFQGLQPELAFEDIHAVTGGFVFGAIAATLATAAVNPTHMTLAYLARSRDIPIYTTNFDDLLERGGAPASRVVHLHGSLRRPRTIGALMSDISRLGSADSIPARQKTLVAMGYSGRDPDVLRLVKKSRYQRVVWCALPGASDIRPRIVQAELADDIRFCLCDIHQVLAALPRDRRSALGVPTTRRPGARGPLSPTWDEATLVFGLLCYRCENFQVAFDFLNRHLVDTSQPVSQRTRVFSEIMRAECGRAVGHSARDSLARLSRILPSAPRLLRREVANTMGMLHLDLLEIGSARQRIDYALRGVPSSASSPLLHRKRATRMRPLRLNNLGLCHYELGQFREARATFVESGRLKLRMGNPLAVINTFHNLALVHTARGDERRVRFWSERALRLVERYAAHRRRGEYLRDRGDAHLRRQDKDSARAAFADGLRMVEERAPHLESLARELRERLALLS